MPIRLILRLLVAAIFATLAVIYSELIPPLKGTDTLAVKILVTVVAGFLGFLFFPDIATKATTSTISIFNFVVQRVSSEILNQLLRLPRPAQRTNLRKSLVVDTSSLIDGRILDIAKTGFISGILIVPNFILLELQQVADSKDSIKRARGRRGFEILNDLKKMAGIKVEIWDKEAGKAEVDEKLIKLAKAISGKILTTDFNLNKMAQTHGIEVLNVNELSNALRTIVIPGEKMTVKIMHLGKNPAQGIGYLSDGTMVVVSEGALFVGQEINIEVTKLLQQDAGRMIFGKTSF